MPDGEELAQQHTILDALRIERDDLGEFGDRLVQRIAGGRYRGWSVLLFAQLAQVDAPQQLVRVEVVGRALEQFARHALGLADAPYAKVQIGQRIVQLRRSRVGVQRQLVLFDGLRHEIRAALGDGLIFIGAGQRQVIVRLGAVRRQRGGVGWFCRRGRSRFCRSKQGGAGAGSLGGTGCHRSARKSVFRPILSAIRPGRQQKSNGGGKGKPEGRQTKFSCHHPGDSLPFQPGQQVKNSKLE